MATRANTRAALVLAIAATVLWQLTSELRHLLVRAGISGSSFWPTGSPFSLQWLALSPQPLAVLGFVLGLAVVFLVTLGLGRAVTRRGVPARGATFLAFWMAVVIGGFVASALTQPLLFMAQRYPAELMLQQLASIAWATYWGVAVGWVAALIAASSATPTAPGQPGGNAAPVGTYAGAAGYAGSAPPTGAPEEPGASLYPNLPQASDSATGGARSPYTHGRGSDE